MSRHVLEVFLPAFVIVFVSTAILWSYWRSRKPIRVVPHRTQLIIRLQRLHYIFQGMVGCCVVIVFLYSYYPDHYELLMPIPFLDHPLINTIGILVLKVSLVWIVMAQVTIDRSIFKINRGLMEWSYRKLVTYSEMMLLSGMVVMFVGLWITLSSAGMLLICVVSLILFSRFILLITWFPERS